jgi:hypothetical protein
MPPLPSPSNTHKGRKVQSQPAGFAFIYIDNSNDDGGEVVAVLAVICYMFQPCFVIFRWYILIENLVIESSYYIEMEPFQIVL